ncbi:hypothetical protein OH805_11275 [Streptomyces sp. NBC_00879]|uniref:hypothetical protein n=1 Tax=Streptomyces sp. NBC_00879 TaxID=2975855 RepID=UPI0038642D3E|nr:hypothetical protein OH805_11275 [Streptomyces sp. NBC_00879]
MPRRGEHKGNFPTSRSQSAQESRIGIREVTGPEGNGAKATVSLDPAAFDCAGLAAELADEWVELATAAGLHAGTNRQYRRAIREFCEHVDATVPHARQASLARADPDLHHAVTEWIRLLPAQHKAGSRTPAWLAGRLRILVGRRIEHRGRPVEGHLHRWVDGSIGLRRGQTQELDEFSRSDKKKLVQAAWADRLAIESRIRRGWDLADSGTDPAVGGWSEPANLLWAIANDAWTCGEISRHLPGWSAMPYPLRDLLPRDIVPVTGKRGLLRFLVRQLFLSNLDLQAYRILLMAATGRASEEVTLLDEDDIEFGPRSVMIDFSKWRAQAHTRQAFSTAAAEPTAVLHPSKPKLDAAEIIRALLELNRPLAKRVGIAPVPLFLRAALPGSEMTVSPLDRVAGGTFRDWLKVKGLSVDGVADIRRLRKSGKVEKAIAFKGRVSDIADDHSVETFHSHYAHGTTLRVIAGNVITAAQQRWFSQAMNGPVVLSTEAEKSLREPGSAAAMGLSPEEVEELRAGELDMGVSSCKNPLDSPYGRPGQLCPVAPTRCLECRNAFVLPSNLPQLLLFSAHLDQLQLRLTPQHFHALWGQSRVNVTEVIKARTDAEIAIARRQIADEGLTLQLPLAAHVEFDA